MRELNDDNLRWLRGLNPMSDEEGAMAASTGVFADLLAQIVSEPLTAVGNSIGDPSEELELSSRFHPARMHGSRRRLLVSGGAAALLVAVLLVGQSFGWFSGSRTRNPSGRIGASSWRLVSDVVPSWRVAAGVGLSPEFQLICPTTTTCYAYAPLVSQGGLTSSEAGAIQVTRDGGATWQQLALPTNFDLAPAMSCSSAEVCEIEGLSEDGGSAFLESFDGGVTWNTQSGPGESTQYAPPRDMSCSSAMSCVVITSGGPRSPNPTAVYATTNGGESWTKGSLPTGFIANPDLDCYTEITCVLGGLSSLSNSNANGFNQGILLYTTDGGASWSQAVTPTGFGEVGSVSCVASGQCLASSDQGDNTGADYVESSDGGATWSQVNAAGLSDDFGMGLTCPTASTCWADGASATPIPDTQPGSVAGEDQLTDVSGLVAYTTDGGQSWQSASLPPNVQDVFDISCPSSTTCFALAVDTSTVAGTSGTPYLITNNP